MTWIGIGNTIWRRGGGVSWSSYWEQQITAYAARVAADGGAVYNGSDGGLTYLTGRSDILTKAYYDEALLVMVPSAVKAGTLYSVKGADFGFTRNLQKWVVNASNILYSSAVNVPALRWDVGRARWEFDKENAASTLITQSLAQDNMLYSMLRLTRGTNTDDSAFGAGTADRGTEDGSSGSHLYYGGWARTSGVTYTMSFIIKTSGRNHVYLNYTGDDQWTCLYDLVNLTATPGGAMSITAGVEAFGDGYCRIWATFTAASDAAAGTNSTNLHLHNGTSTSYAGDGASYIVRAHHNLVVGTINSPMVAGAGNVTRPEDVATATAVIDTGDPYTFVYSLSGQTYIEVYKDGNKTTYIDGVLNGTVAEAASADITLSAVGRYGHFIAFGRELTESEMVFF